MFQSEERHSSSSFPNEHSVSFGSSPSYYPVSEPLPENGMAGLVVLTISLASSLAHLPLFCLHACHFLLPLCHCSLLYASPLLLGLVSSGATTCGVLLLALVAAGEHIVHTQKFGWAVFPQLSYIAMHVLGIFTLKKGLLTLFTLSTITLLSGAREAAAPLRTAMLMPSSISEKGYSQKLKPLTTDCLSINSSEPLRFYKTDWPF